MQGSAQSRGHPTIILLVEDDAPLREVLTRQLTRKEFAVIDHKNGADALSFIKNYTGHIDVLITDIVMPRMDGFALAAEVHAISPRTCVLFITGHAGDRLEIRQALAVASPHVLLKPFSQAQLLEALQPLLAVSGGLSASEVATSGEAVDKGSAQLMTKSPDRRRAERREETFPVSVTTPEPVEIAGQSVDFTSFGVLLTAHGQISVQLEIKGKQYQGRLVRAFPMESGATAYGIELEEALELPETEQH